jgi:tRNA threonylcarbamoyl adenosine modification protein YeaZ
MRILSFDTSTGELHLSLLVDREPVFERLTAPSSSERQEVAQLIVPEIDRAFREAGWQKSELDCVVVGVGPGSFTGIRVAVITARTICQIFKLPLIGVPLLDTYYFATGEKEPAAVVIGSTPPTCFFGAYAATSTDPVDAHLKPSVAAAPAAIDQLKPFSQWFLDEKAAKLLGEHPHQLLPKLKNVGTIQAQLAWDRLSLNGFATEPFAWQNVLPMYLRSPSVTIKKNYAPANPANDPR